MRYEITFLWPDGTWTWERKQARDFHDAVLIGLRLCPDGCRIKSVEPIREPEIASRPNAGDLLKWSLI